MKQWARLVSIFCMQPLGHLCISLFGPVRPVMFLDLPGGNHLLTKLTISLRPMRAVHKSREMCSKKVANLSFRTPGSRLVQANCTGDKPGGPHCVQRQRFASAGEQRSGEESHHWTRISVQQSNYWLSAKGETRNQLQNFEILTRPKSRLFGF